MPINPFNSLIIFIQSGEQIEVEQIKLFLGRDLQEIVALKAKAQQALAGSATGLGLLGSPAWVLSGALILSTLDQAIAKSRTRSGVKFLQEAITREQALRGNGVFVNVCDINSVEHPIPDLWNASQKNAISIDLLKMGLVERGNFIRDHQISREQAKTGKVMLDGMWNYRHNGDEFIVVKGERGERAVRWSSVESLKVPGHAQIGKE